MLCHAFWVCPNSKAPTSALTVHGFDFEHFYVPDARSLHANVYREGLPIHKEIFIGCLQSVILRVRRLKEKSRLQARGFFCARMMSIKLFPDQVDDQGMSLPLLLDKLTHEELQWRL